MGSDRGRRTYDRTRQYRSVVMQQGRVTLEADWNEAQDIVNEAIREETLDVVGPSGTSDAGYRIIETGRPPEEAFDFSVDAGTLYVGGVRVSLDAPLAYSQQTKAETKAEWLDHSSDPEWQDLPAQAVSEFVYLSLREQEVGAVEDSALREVALGGPDTAARTRLIQHIVRRSTDASDCATALGEAASDWLSRGLRFDDQSMRLLSQATLKVGFQSQPLAPNPCEPEVQGGYLGAENQLIRVQISSDNQLVWGFDNASFLYRVEVIDPDTDPGTDAKTLELKSRPVDTSHEPRANQAVEVLRSAAKLSTDEYVASATGFITTLTARYDPDTQQIILDTPLPPEYLDKDATPQVFLRVWEEQVAFTPGTPVALGATGLQVTLRTQDGGRFYIGDYWLFAVRPGTPTQVYPQRYLDPQPPDGPRLWVCPLALIAWDGGVLRLSEDCRRPFSSLTEAVPALHVAIPPNWTNDDFSPLDRLQTEGLQVTLDGIPVPTSQSLSPATMIVTLEIPVIAVPDASIDPRSNVGMILEGSITVENSSIKWRPKTDLTTLLRFFNVTGASRVRVVLKGHTIWSVQGSQTLYLDGQVFGKLGPDRPDPVHGTLTPRIDLDFPSGAGVRASDFESWFYVTLRDVQPEAPTLDSVSLDRNSVFAGRSVDGTVTLSNAALEEVTVKLESEPPSVVEVQPTVVVTKGQTQGRFRVKAVENPPNTDAIIKASLGTDNRTTPLHVRVVRVTIAPTDATTVTGGGQVRFEGHARVDTTDTPVRWTATGGIVSVTTDPHVAVYTASDVAGDFEVTVSTVDPVPPKSASAKVRIQLRVSVEVEPKVEVILLLPSSEPGEDPPSVKTDRFTAKVTGSTNKEVKWSLDEETEGANIDSSSGLFTATSVGRFTVRATSVVAPVSDTGHVRVKPLIIKVPNTDKNPINDNGGKDGLRAPIEGSQNRGLGKTGAETSRPGDDPPKKRKRRKKTVGQSSEHANDGSDEGRAFIRSEERPEVGTALLKPRG